MRCNLRPVALVDAVEVRNVPEQLYTGIDIGSTKFSAAVANADPTRGISYLGHGSVPAGGIRTGEIVDQGSLDLALLQAIREARTLSGIAIEDIVVSISGAQFFSVTRQGQVSIDSGYPIYQPDIDRVIKAAYAEDEPDLKTIHRIVQGFAINGEPVHNPLGRMGQTLQVKIRDIVVSKALVEGIQLAASAQRVQVHAIVPTAVASGEAVLRTDERERGVILLDIGGSSTEVGFYGDGNLHDVGSIQVGGHHITRDLAMLLDVPLEDAEYLKSLHGVSVVGGADDLGIDWSPRGIATIQNQARNGTLRRDIPRAIAGARVEQILAEIEIMLQQLDPNLQFYAGVVITGGASRLPGLADVISARTQMSARCGDILPGDGFPEIADPTASASIGLVRYCASRAQTTTPPRRQRQETQQWMVDPNPQVAQVGDLGYTISHRESSGRPWGQVMREWMRGFIPARTDA